MLVTVGNVSGAAELCNSYVLVHIADPCHRFNLYHWRSRRHEDDDMVDSSVILTLKACERTSCLSICETYFTVTVNTWQISKYSIHTTLNNQCTTRN